jgi:ribosomal protein L37AE/L43A
MKAIGIIKAKHIVYCEICGSSLHRTANETVYENTDIEKSRAMKKVSEKLQKPYTCKVCKSIEKMKRQSYKPTSQIQLSLFDTPQPIQKVDEFEQMIKNAESTGQYQFPTVPPLSHQKAIVNESITFKEFYENDDCWRVEVAPGRFAIFDENEMIQKWNFIQIQRVHFKCALMVFEGKFKGINEALRKYSTEFN